MDTDAQALRAPSADRQADRQHGRRRIPVIVICAAILVVTLVSDRRSGGDPQGFHAFTPGDGAAMGTQWVHQVVNPGEAPGAPSGQNTVTVEVSLPSIPAGSRKIWPQEPEVGVRVLPPAQQSTPVARPPTETARQRSHGTC